MWYFNNSGIPEGPVEETQLLGLLASRQLDASTLVWQEGMGDWEPARSVFPHLQVATAQTTSPPRHSRDQKAIEAEPTMAPLPIPAPSAPSPQAAPVTPHKPYTAPQYTPPAYRPSSGLATASMVLGIISIIFVFSTCILGPLTSIPAIITGHMALRQLRDTPGMSGYGQAQAGLWLGWSITLLTGLGIAFLVAAIILSP